MNRNIDHSTVLKYIQYTLDCSDDDALHRHAKYNLGRGEIEVQAPPTLDPLSCRLQPQQPIACHRYRAGDSGRVQNHPGEGHAADFIGADIQEGGADRIVLDLTFVFAHIIVTDCQS